MMGLADIAAVCLTGSPSAQMATSIVDIPQFKNVLTGSCGDGFLEALHPVLMCFIRVSNPDQLANTVGVVCHQCGFEFILW